MNALQVLLARLEGVRQTAADAYVARCPAHDDKNPSLSLKVADDRVLMFCWAGCETAEVMAALGLTLADLFERRLDLHKPPLSHYQRRRHGQALDALRAIRHEADIVLQAGCELALKHSEIERLMLAVDRIHAAVKVAT